MADGFVAALHRIDTGDTFLCGWLVTGSASLGSSICTGTRP
jgi:hypothetical protein